MMGAVAVVAMLPNEVGIHKLPVEEVKMHKLPFLNINHDPLSLVESGPPLPSHDVAFSCGLDQQN